MDVTHTRTRNITMLVNEAGGPTAFGKLIDRDQVQVSQWTSPTNPKPVGGRLARYLEGKLGRERGWLDQPQWSDGVAPGSQSQLVRLDADMLAETHKACRKFAHRQGKKFSVEADPARFLQVYLVRVKLPAQPSEDELMEFGATVQTIMTTPQGASEDGRSDGVPTAGTDEQDVAGGSRRGKAGPARRA